MSYCNCKCENKHKIDIDEFKDFKLEDINTFYDITKNSGNIISAYDFVNLYVWKNHHKSKWLICDNILIIYQGDTDALLLPDPAYDLTSKDLTALSDCMLEQGHSGNFIHADGDYVNEHKQTLEEHFEIIIDYDNMDYIYLLKNMCELSGKRLKKKRNLIRQFVKLYPDYQVKKLGRSDFYECLKLADEWAEHKHSGDNSNFSDDLPQLRIVFDEYEKLQVEGLCIKINDKVVAFSVFNEQNKDSVVYHFEKYSPEIKGCGQVMTYETSRLLLKRGYKYINREQDIGMKGLRRAKRSYDPIFLKEVYKLIRK